jgi:hypothetical protein
MEYSGIDAALLKLGHTMYSPATIDSEHLVQRAVTLGDALSRAGFRNLMANVQQLCIYLGMLGGKLHVTMIHTPGIYYSIKLSMRTYQGKIIAFIGDRRVTKNPPWRASLQQNHWSGTWAMQLQISKRLRHTTQSSQTRAPCGYRGPMMPPHPQCQCQTSWQSQMHSSTSSAHRARPSSHVMFLPPWTVLSRVAGPSRVKSGIASNGGVLWHARRATMGEVWCSLTLSPSPMMTKNSAAG